MSRYIQYPVDQTRVNEFGQSFAEKSEEKKEETKKSQ